MKINSKKKKKCDRNFGLKKKNVKVQVSIICLNNRPNIHQQSIQLNVPVNIY